VTSVRAYAPGIYPRSEALVQATRDLDRGRIGAAQADEAFAADLQALVAVQQEAGLDLLTDGMLRWQDLFRPFVDASDGLDTGALTRFLDTNTFYRAPRATGELALTRSLGADVIAPLPGPRLVTLPSPFAFAHAAGLDPVTVASSLLAPALEDVDAALVVLAEPFLAREREPDLGALRAALETLPRQIPLVLQLTFGDGGALLAQLTELPLDGVGVDFYATSFDAVPEGFPLLLLAGVVDARSSGVEDTAVIADFALRLGEHVAGGLALVPNGDLHFVAEPIARRKLEALAAARAPVSEVTA
jgi:5-methyltetrahydropteroyltriglutamate--homocysteine methyltransferase